MMMASVVIGAAIVAPGIDKTARTNKLFKKVESLKNRGDYDYLAISDVDFQYTRPLRGGRHEPIYSSIARIKQDMEGRENRVLTVTRRKNGTVNFILLKRSAANTTKDIDNPLNVHTVDPNLKTNQGDIIDSLGMKVTKKSSNTFILEDKNYRAVQTHKKLIQIEVLEGQVMCELLTYMAEQGYVPREFPSLARRESMESKDIDKEQVNVASTSATTNENESTEYASSVTNHTESSAQSSSSELQSEFSAPIVTEAREHSSHEESDVHDEVIPVAMAILVEE